MRAIRTPTTSYVQGVSQRNALPVGRAVGTGFTWEYKEVVKGIGSPRTIAALPVNQFATEYLKTQPCLGSFRPLLAPKHAETPGLTDMDALLVPQLLDQAS